MKWSKRKTVKHTEDGKGNVTKVSMICLKHPPWCSRPPSPIPQYCFSRKHFFLFLPSLQPHVPWSEILSLQLKVGLQGVMSAPWNSCFSSTPGGARSFSGLIGSSLPVHFPDQFPAQGHYNKRYCFAVIKCLCCGMMQMITFNQDL